MNKLFYKSKLYLKRVSPTILTVVGAAGVVATAMVAVKSTPKAMEILERERWQRYEDGANKHVDPLKPIEIVGLTWKCYIPAVAIGLSTIACIFGVNILNKHDQATVASAYAFLHQSYQQYRKTAKVVYGEDADSRIQAEIAKSTYISADGYDVYDAEFDQTSEKMLFYDVYSKRYFSSTLPAVIQAQYHLNRNFTLRGDASVNEFYEFLGLEKIAQDDDIGWGYELTVDGIMWIDFDNEHVKMEDGMECYIISTPYAPTLY